MVDFTLSEDQVNLQEPARGFAQQETCASAWDYAATAAGRRRSSTRLGRSANEPPGLRDVRWRRRHLIAGGLSDLQEPNGLASAVLVLGRSEKRLQVYGGYGVIRACLVEKLMRDAKIMQLYEGTCPIQWLVRASETLLPRRVDEPAAAD